MPIMAMFVKIDGKWGFQGISDSEYDIARFVRDAEYDIQLTKKADMVVKTEKYKIVYLED